ncbi:MAG: FkbM family methyltransferase, partial [Bdellovibrionales bacterium]|nr:FkbM family methyltransferase [Bdellovibrionales bacterium]NQZ20119.1 FkbM family methyltransferase [Bdellovibrionales bacterium]
SSIKTQTSIELLWEHRDFEINPKETIGRSIQTFGLYDLVLSEALFRLVKHNSFCLDIGANIGFFTSLMSYKGAIVNSFEPHPKIFERLNKNCKNLNNVTCHQKALSDKKGKLSLYIPNKFSSNEGIASLNPQEDSAEISVEVETLDNLFPNTTIDLIKIDVEGHESSVFKGAQSLLENRLIKNILLEEFDGENAKSITLLKDYGFRVYRLHKGFLNLKRLTPAQGANLPLWEPPNYLACLDEPDWGHFKSWQILKL